MNVAIVHQDPWGPAPMAKMPRRVSGLHKSPCCPCRRFAWSRSSVAPWLSLKANWLENHGWDFHGFSIIMGIIYDSCCWKKICSNKQNITHQKMDRNQRTCDVLAHQWWTITILVGGFNHLKNMKANGKEYPLDNGHNKKIMFQTTNQNNVDGDNWRIY